MPELARGPHHLLVGEPKPGAVEVGGGPEAIKKDARARRPGAGREQQDLVETPGVLARGDKRGRPGFEPHERRVGGRA